MKVKIKSSIIIILLIVCSCNKTNDSNTNTLGHEFEIDPQLYQDDNGYYHLDLVEDWQTLHRITGTVSAVENEFELTKVYWESSHFWTIGDTLGYIVDFNLSTEECLYISNDTSYITFFEGFEVPTINSVSYSTMEGEINTMFAPVQNMLGDTIQIISEAHFADGFISNPIIIDVVID